MPVSSIVCDPVQSTFPTNLDPARIRNGMLSLRSVVAAEHNLFEAYSKNLITTDYFQQYKSLKFGKGEKSVLDFAHG